MCYSASEDKAREIAHRYHRWSLAGGPVMPELPDTDTFAAASSPPYHARSRCRGGQPRPLTGMAPHGSPYCSRLTLYHGRHPVGGASGGPGFERLVLELVHRLLRCEKRAVVEAVHVYDRIRLRR